LRHPVFSCLLDTGRTVFYISSQQLMNASSHTQCANRTDTETSTGSSFHVMSINGTNVILFTDLYNVDTDRRRLSFWIDVICGVIHGREGIIHGGNIPVRHLTQSDGVLQQPYTEYTTQDFNYRSIRQLNATNWTQKVGPKKLL